MPRDNQPLVSQLICFNPAGTALTPEEEAFIVRHQIRSFVLFARNLTRLDAARALIDRLHTLAEHPLIAADQEGGRVIRLPAPATHLPSPMALGATRSADLAFRAGQATARELRAMRLNIALAPVLDINSNPANPVIGTRSFGETPELVTDMGLAWLRGARGAGVATCAKHFPGHGDTHVDSHAGLPRIDKPRAAIERCELVPFHAAVRAGIDLVMPGHLLLPALDDARPASLSQKIVTGLLRTELGFDGVVITDALDMDAVAVEYGIPRAAAEAACAGCDLVVPIVQHEETLRALQDAAEDGRLPMAGVEQSVQRLSRLRARAAPSAAADSAWLGLAEHQALAREIAQRAIRVDDPTGSLPVRNLEDYAVVEFSLGKATIAEGVNYGSGKVLACLRERYSMLAGMALPFDPGTEVRHEVMAIASSAAGLILVTRQALQFPAQQSIVRELLAMGKPAVLIAMRDPYDLDLFPEARCRIAAFDDSPAMVAEAANVLWG